MKRRSQDKRKIILGVTGSFGSGKTTVARILGSFGAKVIDADKLAHDAIRPGSSAYRKIIKAFGQGVLKKNKTIDRDKLGKLVFNAKPLLKELNNIVHPEVIRQIKERVRKSAQRVIILDVPLLIESGLDSMIDMMAVVTITREKQVQRIIDKTGLSRADILKRIKSQIPLRKKAELADFVIDNSGTIIKTKKQLEQIRRLLWRN